MRRWTLGVSALALLVAGEAAAQEAGSGSATPLEAPQSAPPAPNAGDATPDGGLEDIIVTATRRETLLQTTPIAITAVTAEAFEDLGARRIEDLARYTPGLFIQQATFSGAGGPSIRGIGSFSLIASASFPVAFYYDGLFQDRPFGNNLRLFDISRIEVLRGPQGVLFGRNATAGAVRVEFALPTDELAIRARGAYGSFDSYEGQVSIRGPVADGVKLGLSGTYADSEGYGTNVFNGAKVYGYNVENVRASIVLEPTERLSLIVRGNYTRENNTFGLKQVFAGPTGAPILADNQNIALFGTPVLGVDEFANNFPSFNTVTRRSLSAEATWELGGFDIVALVGYNDSDNISDSDTDGGDNRVFIRPTSILNHTENRYEGRQAELRISSNGWERFQLDAGFFYINERVSDGGSTLGFFNTAGVALVNSRAVEGGANTDAYAVFAHGRFELTDRLNLRAGLRYTQEEKKGAAQAQNLITGVILPRRTAGTSDDAFTPQFGADYEFSEGTFGYLTIANGFKSGGFTVDPNTGIAVVFEKETVWNYEAGLKTDLFDKRLRLNTAVFYTDYADLQVTQNLPNGGAQTSNAASARVYGVELEAVARPFERLSISGSLAYLNAEYEDYVYIPARTAVAGVPATPTSPAIPARAANAEFNLGGERLERAPEWKGSVVAEYTLPTPIGGLSVQGVYSYESEVFFAAVPDSPVALVGPPSSPPFERSRLYKRRAIGLVDARVELTLPGDQLSIALYGSNLTNSRYFGALTRLGGGTSTIGNVNQPRAFRVEVSFKY